jgi:hypothetical protein
MVNAALLTTAPALSPSSIPTWLAVWIVRKQSNVSPLISALNRTPGELSIWFARNWLPLAVVGVLAGPSGNGASPT